MSSIITVKDVSLLEDNGLYSYADPANKGKLILSKNTTSGSYILAMDGTTSYFNIEATAVITNALEEVGTKIKTPTNLRPATNITVDELLRLKANFTGEEIIQLHVNGII